MRPVVTMDSETYRQPAAQRRSPGQQRARLADTRYPYLASGATDGVTATRDRQAGIQRGSEKEGRVRAAVLIMFAVVALSAIAAIGWMQYQSSAAEDPQYEISEPDHSVPALADSSRR